MIYADPNRNASMHAPSPKNLGSRNAYISNTSPILEDSARGTLDATSIMSRWGTRSFFMSNIASFVKLAEVKVVIKATSFRYQMPQMVIVDTLKKCQV